MGKSPVWLRISQIVLGAIAIVLSGWMIANPAETALLYIAFLGIALIMVGFNSRIGVDCNWRSKQKSRQRF